MNKIKNIIFTFTAVVLVQFGAFAQDGLDGLGDFGGDAGDNPTDLTIDSYLSVLLVVGFGYVFYKYRFLIWNRN